MTNPIRIVTPVTPETVHLLLQRLEDETGVRWRGGCLPTETDMLDISEAYEIMFYDGCIKWMAVRGWARDEARCQTVTWNEFVKIVKERCPK